MRPLPPPHPALLALLLALALLAPLSLGADPDRVVRLGADRKKVVERRGHIPEPEAQALARLFDRRQDVLLEELRGGGAAGTTELERYKHKLGEEDFAKDPCSMAGTQCGTGHVRVISLRKTRLRGEIPEELEALSHLTSLDLSHNQLSGPVPAWLATLKQLEKLNLAENALTGPLPSSLGELGKLRVLILADNQFSGPIPSELGRLQILEHLDVAGNKLSGVIPSQLGLLPHLRKVGWQHGGARRGRNDPKVAGDNELLCPAEWGAGASAVPPPLKLGKDCTEVHAEL